jgi:hypothetical protein
MRQFNKSGIKLKGFDEFIEKLAEAGAKAETEGKKCFDGCVDNFHTELKQKATAANVPAYLVNEIEVENRSEHGSFYAEIGWNKPDWSGKGEIPDAYKVLFWNYGTPRRATKTGGQRVNISGQWRTVGTDRGKIEAKHFIGNAKRAAANRNRKLQRETLDKILKGLPKE